MRRYADVSQAPFIPVLLISVVDAAELQTLLYPDISITPILAKRQSVVLVSKDTIIFFFFFSSQAHFVGHPSRRAPRSCQNKNERWWPSHLLPRRGSSASAFLASRISLVPRLPSPPSLRLSHPPSRTTSHVALSPSMLTSVA